MDVTRLSDISVDFEDFFRGLAGRTLFAEPTKVLVISEADPPFAKKRKGWATQDSSWRRKGAPPAVPTFTINPQCYEWQIINN